MSGRVPRDLIAAALDAHARLSSTRPALDPTLRADAGTREDYQYNRMR